MISRRIPPDGLVVIDHVPGEEYLHFTVMQGAGTSDAPEDTRHAREIEVG
jgi:hypothetical protein